MAVSPKHIPVKCDEKTMFLNEFHKVILVIQFTRRRRFFKLMQHPLFIKIISMSKSEGHLIEPSWLPHSGFIINPGFFALTQKCFHNFMA